MSAPKPPRRPAGALDLPSEPYMPGRNARPDAALFAPLKAGIVAGSAVAELAASDAFRGGREAFAREYFWEAHELWEAVWLALPPASAERHLLRGLIQLANAGLKRRMDEPKAATRAAGLADTALAEAFLHAGQPLMGLGRDDLPGLRDHALGRKGVVKTEL